MKRRRAKNKIQGSLDDESLATPEPESPVRAVILRSAAVAVPRRQSTLFNAELEEAIDVIARERVYRMMLARLRGRLLLMGPLANDEAAT